MAAEPDARVPVTGGWQAGPALSAYLALAFVLSSLWTQFDAIGWGVALLLPLTLALDWRPEWFVSIGSADTGGAPREDGTDGGWLPPGLTRQAVAIGVVICVPVFAHLFLTRNEEFPFGGDEGYEFSASRAYAILLKDSLPFVLVWAGLVFGIARRFGSRVPRLTLFLAGLYVLSFRFPPHIVVARFPATFYFLATPLNVFATVAGWKSPYFANHIVNALSLPAWLFLLRPALVRRWPDWRIAPLAAFLFFQKEVVYVFAGGQAIEPWAFVFVLLAFEALVTLPDERAWLACILAGGSFMFKEPGIFLFPVVWLLALRTMRPASVIRHIGCGLAVLSPFVVYYVVRQMDVRILRTVSFRSTARVFTAARMDTWVHRTAGEFGRTGLIAAALLVLYAVAGAWWLRRDRLFQRFHAGVVAAACGLLVFYFSEDAALEWIAYARYMLYPMFLGGLLLIPLTIRLERRGMWRTIVAGSAAILVCQAVPTVGLIRLDLRPEYARNSLEWTQIPTFYPVRALVERALARPDAGGLHDLRLLSISAVDPVVAPIAYPDLNRRLTIRPALTTAVEQCSCRREHEATLVGLPFRAGSDLDEPEALTQPTPAFARACVAELRRTCSTVLEAFHDTGALVGVLGLPAVSQGGAVGSGQ